jgi:hypothetical protein
VVRFYSGPIDFFAHFWARLGDPLVVGPLLRRPYGDGPQKNHPPAAGKTVFVHYRAYSDRTCGRSYTRVYGREAKNRVWPALRAGKI